MSYFFPKDEARQLICRPEGVLAGCDGLWTSYSVTQLILLSTQAAQSRSDVVARTCGGCHGQPICHPAKCLVISPPRAFGTRAGRVRGAQRPRPAQMEQAVCFVFRGRGGAGRPSLCLSLSLSRSPPGAYFASLRPTAVRLSPLPRSGGKVLPPPPRRKFLISRTKPENLQLDPLILSGRGRPRPRIRRRHRGD